MEKAGMGIENGKIKPLAPADSSGSEEINKSDTFIFSVKLFTVKWR